MRTLTVALTLVFMLVGSAFSAANAKTYREPTPNELHNALDMPSAASQKFDARRWKSQPASRWTMLFDLVRFGMFGKSQEEGRALLGEPDAKLTAPWGGKGTDLYDLGNCGAEQVFLEVSYGATGKDLSCFRLMYVPNGKISTSDFGWITKNINGEQAADIINENRCLVGMPVIHICQVMGHPRRVSATNNRACGMFEFEYTADAERVKRFRVFYRKPGSEELIPSRWQYKDYRSDSRSFTDAIAIVNSNVSGIDSNFLQPGAAFSQKIWQTAKWHRPQMLFDLWTTYSVIGMKKDAVHDLLGAPDITKLNISGYHPCREGPPESPQIDQNSEWYLIHWPVFCGNPPSTYLQIVYDNDRVSKFRLDHRGGSAEPMGYRFGHISIANRPAISKPAPEEVISEYTPKLIVPRTDDEPGPTILEERYMKTGRSERTLALPGTLPPDAPIPDTK